ncbi:MAG: CPBP family intramembrane metalloprotease [Chloroflexota bacterium]|nr:CPBP family intramembrane metalloprotease [Chloroflexota bacterium]
MPWRLRDLGLAAASVLAASVFTLIVLGSVLAFLGDTGSDVEMAGLLTAALVVDVAFVAAAGWFGVRRYSCGWRALGFRPPVRGGWWVPLAVVLAAYVALGVYFTIVELAGLGKLVPQSTLEDAFDNWALLPLVGVLAIVAAPIAEETFFRGFLFPGLRSRWGTLWAALVSSLLFASLHFDLGSIIPFTVIGMLFVWAYVFSGSLWTSIVAHFAFNSISFLLAVATGGGS